MRPILWVSPPIIIRILLSRHPTSTKKVSPKIRIFPPNRQGFWSIKKRIWHMSTVAAFLLVLIKDCTVETVHRTLVSADISQIRFFIYQNPCLLGGKNLIMGVTFLWGLGWRESKILIMRVWRHSKYRSHMLINGCDKKMKLIGRKPKYR